MNRAESAVFVERGVHSTSYDPPTPSSQVFADLALDSWAAKWVHGLWEDQYTAGCGTNPLMYCPWQGHTRAEGAVFYLRMMHGATYVPPEPTVQTFTDVQLGTWYAGWVEAAYGAGLITACQSSPELRFCPEDPLTRGLAAYMMYQAKQAPASREIIPADRRIDWSYAGIPGGIPERSTICTTIDSAVYGSGTTDATSTIQTALTNCPDDQVVYLPAGTYLISNTIWMRSHDTLRGAGPGKTTLKHTGTNTGSVIQVANGMWGELIGQPEIHTIVEAKKDAQVIALDSTAGISPGDLLLLNQLNDGVNVDSVGSNGKCTFCGLANGDRSLGQFVEVTSVDGNKVHLNVPLHWTYDTTLTPWAYQIDGSAITRWMGIEDMTLTQDAAVVRDMIFLQGVQYSWIRNVEITNVYSSSIFTYYAVQSEFRDNYMHTGISGFGHSMGYGIALSMYSSNNLVYNNIADSLDGGGIENHGGASGNVMAYNYLHDILYDDPTWLVGSPMIEHGAHPKMNLWEGNVAYMAEGDFVWGSASHDTIFRSRSMGWMNDTRIYNNAAIRFATKNTYMNVVGSVLGTPGKSNRYETLAGQPYNSRDIPIWVLGVSTTSVGGAPDPRVAETIYRRGNFDYYNNAVVDWDPNNPNHTLPASLYLGQKPSWWCQESPWPAIGPDVAGLVNAIPAQRRFEGLPCTQGNALTMPLSATPSSAVVSLGADNIIDSDAIHSLP
jgi:hypothetical protein